MLGFGLRHIKRPFIRNPVWVLQGIIAGLFVCAAFVLAGSISLSAQTASLPTDLMAQADTARLQNNLSEAIALYSRVVAHDPNSAEAWWYLGSLQYGTGAYDQARDALSHYIELMPKAGPALALRGLCEFETSQYREALQDIQRGISLGAANQPRNEQILRYHEALLLTRLGDFDNALKVYAYFAKNDIRNAELTVAVGLAGLHRPLLPQDVEADQKNLLSETGTAVLDFLSGRENIAQQDFAGLFRNFPQTSYIHFLYGYLLLANDPDGALDQFKQELKLASANIDARVMIAWILLLRSDPTGALPYAQMAAESAPENIAAQLVVGKALVGSGDAKDGVEHLKKVLDRDPNNLEAHIALAEAYSKSGQKEEARRERILCLKLTDDSAAETTP